MEFSPDPEQERVLAHARGPLVVTGAAGTGKTRVLRERLARLIEGGADPERVALVVRTAGARAAGKKALLARLASSLPGMKVLTVHGLAHHVLSRWYGAVGYEQPPDVLNAQDQFGTVQELLRGEDAADWPAYGRMLSLHGFADQVRQFLLRAQESLTDPDEILELAAASGLTGWRELAAFYRRYLQVLDDRAAVDFAGLVNQAAAAAAAVGATSGPPFDHVMVDDYQEATFATERLIVELAPVSLVVAGDEGSHVSSFQGTTDVPLKRFGRSLPTAGHAVLSTAYRCAEPALQSWFAAHASEEHAAVARELRRIHVQEGVPWDELAVIGRRQGPHLTGLLRALDDAGVPRVAPEAGLSLPSEAAAYPFVLALRWLARPKERDGLAESLLTSELARLSPAAARGLVRAALAAGEGPASALGMSEGLGPEEAVAVSTLSDVLRDAGEVAGRSVLDAFSILWRRLPYSLRLVAEADVSPSGRRDMEAVLALSEVVARAGERSDSSVAAFLEELEGTEDAPGLTDVPGAGSQGAVSVLTAHATAGLEFDTVIVTGAVEGNFPSLSRPEPMFDLGLLRAPVWQAERNRLRLEDERRLFHVVATRARRRVVFTASEAHGEETKLTARSRFVGELGVEWTQPATTGLMRDPLSVAEAESAWRRSLADPMAPVPMRLAGLEGLLAIGERPGRWWFQRDWTGTDRPLHEGVRVSFSKLDKLDNCGLQFVLSEELGLEGAAGYHAWVGHLVHRLIEECEGGGIARTEEALVAEAERRWRPQEFPSFAVSEAFRRTVTREMLPNWLAAYGGTPALAKELRFEFEFQGATVSGFIDRVGRVDSGGTQITDYKTGKSRGANAEDNLQLGIYYLAVTQAEELAEFRPTKAVELAFLRESKNGGPARVQLGMTSTAQQEYEQKMAERLSGLIGRIHELLRTETYRPDPAANCRFCDFKTLCPIWPEGKELFPASRSVSSGRSVP